MKYNININFQQHDKHYDGDIKTVFEERKHHYQVMKLFFFFMPQSSKALLSLGNQMQRLTLSWTTYDNL